MIFTNFKRVVRSGFVNFWRQSSVSLAAVITISVTLFVIGSLFIGRAFLLGSLEEIKSQVDISVSFQPTALPEAVLEIKDQVALLPEVKTVTYSSREQELADFRKRNKDNALIIQSLEEVGNPLGARLNIIATDPIHYETIIKFLEAKGEAAAALEHSLIDDISFKKSSVERLLRIISSTERVGLVVSLVLIFMSVVVTFNTIALTIYVSREEISVMSLVGADPSYIRGPFIIEGALSGLIGALAAVIALYPASLWLRNTTANVYGGVDLLAYYLANFIPIFFILIVIGIFLGVASSALAVKRRLKV